MKFTILALAGVINATQIVLPTIEWNDQKISQIQEIAENWADKADKDEVADKDATLKDLSKAFARKQVGEYVSFGKNLKPLAQTGVEIVDSLTVSGKCNREVATECVNDFLWNRSTRAVMEDCLDKKASCAPTWQSMSPADRQALATKFHTNVEVLGKAYDEVNQRFFRDMQAGWAAHLQRKEAMLKDFEVAAEKAATTFGCDMKCIRFCIDEHPDDPHCYTTCSCGEGVIKITPQKINTLAIVKETYGDLNSLTDEDLETVNNLLNLN
jgi:hypothetical protein